MVPKKSRFSPKGLNLTSVVFFFFQEGPEFQILYWSLLLPAISLAPALLLLALLLLSCLAPQVTKPCTTTGSLHSDREAEK